MIITCLGNPGVAKNSRIAKRYTTHPRPKEAMKRGPPRSPKLREQIVRATSKVAPSMYTLHAEFIFTVLRCPSFSYPSGTVPP